MSAYNDIERGTWYCRFRYTDYTGEKHETTKRGFKTKKAALQYEAELKVINIIEQRAHLSSLR